MEEIYAIALEMWPDPTLAAEMAATAMAESGGIPNRLGDAGEYGLWQIHPMHFDPNHARWVGQDEYNNSLKKLGIIDGEGQSLSDPRINARAADAIARHLDRYTNHWDEGDLDMDAVFYGRRDNPDFPLFLEQAQALIGSDPPLTSSIDDGPGPDTVLGPSSNDPTAPSNWPSPWGERPQMPGAKGPTPGDVKATFDPVPFNERVMRAMKDKNTPKIIPLHTGMSSHELAGLQRGIQDPALKASLGKYAQAFLTGDASIVGYETDEAAKAAPGWLRPFGIGVDLDYPFIVYGLGKKALEAGGDVGSWLYDKGVGSLWGSDD
jgi:hypothetical protein